MLRPNGSIIGRDSDGMLVDPFMHQAFGDSGDHAAILEAI
jgi:hypothetical protein